MHYASLNILFGSNLLPLTNFKSINPYFSQIILDTQQQYNIHRKHKIIYRPSPLIICLMLKYFFK